MSAILQIMQGVYNVTLKPGKHVASLFHIMRSSSIHGCVRVLPR